MPRLAITFEASSRGISSTKSSSAFFGSSILTSTKKSIAFPVKHNRVHKSPISESLTLQNPVKLYRSPPSKKLVEDY
jgi:hypothetical protein